MRFLEVFESKNKKTEAPKPRNFVAKNAKTSGAGSHSSKKFDRKVKHKNKSDQKDSD